MLKPLSTDPFEHFRLWMDEAEKTELNDANAMTVSTADADGRPSARILLLKEFDESGFVFYTNHESRKGRHLSENPYASLLFHWKSARRQVRIEGPVSRVDDAESDAYFASRPRGSRVGAWASQQSRPLSDRDALMAEVARYDKQFEDSDVPRPPYWFGSRVTPMLIEFWQDGEFRLHDRFQFTRQSLDDPWSIQRLFP